MDKITTGTGREILTDYFASIPNPKMIFFRATALTPVELMPILYNGAEMSVIHYNGYSFRNCTCAAVTDEDGVPKAHLNYEVMGGRA